MNGFRVVAVGFKLLRRNLLQIIVFVSNWQLWPCYLSRVWWPEFFRGEFSCLLLQTAEEEVEETKDESFVEDAADIDARRMAMKAAEGLHPKLLN